NAEEPQRVVRQEIRHAPRRAERRPALIGGLLRQAEKVEDGRRRVDQAHGSRDARLSRLRAGDGDDERHVYVLLVELKRMAEVAVVLPERFAVIAGDDPQRVPIESAPLEAADEIAERRVPVMERVAIAAELITGRKRAGLRRVVRVMSGNRQ